VSDRQLFHPHILGPIDPHHLACFLFRELDTASSNDANIQESIADELDRGDGWAILDDGDLGSSREAHADCTRMIIVAGESFSVAWSYRVGSEPIRTVDVPLADLAARLGSPLGNALMMIP
jgi:hypothetical protein